jgi:hypothetical protein
MSIDRDSSNQEGFTVLVHLRGLQVLVLDLPEGCMPTKAECLLVASRGDCHDPSHRHLPTLSLWYDDLDHPLPSDPLVGLDEVRVAPTGEVYVALALMGETVKLSAERQEESAAFDVLWGDREGSLSRCPDLEPLGFGALAVPGLPFSRPAGSACRLSLPAGRLRTSRLHPSDQYPTLWTVGKGLPDTALAEGLVLELQGVSGFEIDYGRGRLSLSPAGGSSHVNIAVSNEPAVLDKRWSEYSKNDPPPHFGMFSQLDQTSSKLSSPTVSGGFPTPSKPICPTARLHSRTWAFL